MVYQTIRIVFLDDKAKSDEELPPVSAVFHNVDFFKEAGSIIIQKAQAIRGGFDPILGISEERVISFVVSNPQETKKEE